MFTQTPFWEHKKCDLHPTLSFDQVPVVLWHEYSASGMNSGAGGGGGGWGYFNTN